MGFIVTVTLVPHSMSPLGLADRLPFEPALRVSLNLSRVKLALTVTSHFGMTKVLAFPSPLNSTGATPAIAFIEENLQWASAVIVSVTVSPALTVVLSAETLPSDIAAKFTLYVTVCTSTSAAALVALSSVAAYLTFTVPSESPPISPAVVTGFQVIPPSVEYSISVVMVGSSIFPSRAPSSLTFVMVAPLRSGTACACFFFTLARAEYGVEFFTQRTSTSCQPNKYDCAPMSSVNSLDVWPACFFASTSQMKAGLGKSVVTVNLNLFWPKSVTAIVNE